MRMAMAFAIGMAMTVLMFSLARPGLLMHGRKLNSACRSGSGKRLSGSGKRRRHGLSGKPHRHGGTRCECNSCFDFVSHAVLPSFGFTV